LLKQNQRVFEPEILGMLLMVVEAGDVGGEVQEGEDRAIELKMLFAVALDIFVEDGDEEKFADADG
jgi:hypothetical protein